MFAELFSNLSILVVLSMLSTYFKGLQSILTLRSRIIIGLLYGIVTIIGMNIPFTFAEGLIFDGRSVIISMAAFFFGNIVTVIVVVVAAAYRIFIGGVGVFVGVAVIVSSAAIGLFFHFLNSKRFLSKNLLSFFLLGLSVHLVMILLMTLLPSGITHEVFVQVSPWVILLYVPFTIVFGLMLNNQEYIVKNHILLKESEKRFRSIFENSTLGIYRTSPEGKVLLANNALINMLGYDNFEDLASLNLEESEYGITNRRELFSKQIEKYGQVKGFEATWKKKNKENIYVLESAIGFRDHSGKLLYYEGIVEDITKRKQIEAELRESEALFKSLTQEAPVGIFRTDTIGNTTFVNPFWCEITGLTSEEAKGFVWLDAVHPDDRKYVKQAWDKAIENKTPSILEYRFLRKDRSIAWVSGKAVPQIGENGEFNGFIGTTTDITKKMIAKQSLMESETKFRKLIEFAPVGIVISDSNDNTQFVNKKFVELTGYNIDDQPTINHWWPLAYPDEEYREVLKRGWNKSVAKAIANKSEIPPMESKVRCKDGSYKFLDIGFVSIGEINIVTFIDITDRKKVEGELLSLKNQLEEKVKDQTQELQTKIRELEEFREITLSREFRIAELRDEIKRLRGEL